MFKSVEFSGFEEKPGLKLKAEQLTNVLAGEIHRWRDEVEVQWSPDPADPASILKLTLSLTLPNGLSESVKGSFMPKDGSEEWLVRSRCREIWSDLLGNLLNKQDKRVKESLLESVEV
jgi:hypothetical protein